jgi:hypothetical protein
LELALSLPETIRGYAGKLVYFIPWYGWGWFTLDTAGGEQVPTDYGEIDKAGTFQIRVHHFFSFHGELRGVIGKVEQPGHLFDGFWAVTWTMLVGEWDLLESLCWRWDMQLGRSEPSGNEWPDEPKTPPAYFGYGGVLSVSLVAYQAWRTKFEAGPRAS